MGIDIKETNKVPVEFYMLFDDYTWDTDVIDIPKYLVSQYNEHNSPNQIIGWVYNNEKFNSSVCIIGIYSIRPMEETQW